MSAYCERPRFQRPCAGLYRMYYGGHGANPSAEQRGVDRGPNPAIPFMVTDLADPS